MQLCKERLPLLTAQRAGAGGVEAEETTLDDFKALNGQPRHIRNQAYTAMTVLKRLIHTTNALVKNKPDKLMILFSVTDPEFYDACLRARTIVD